MMSFLTDPLAFEFFQRALVAALLVGVLCPIVGSYVVLRGMAFLGDALAHIILPGVVIAFLLGIPLVVGALVMGIVTAFAIGALSERNVLREDSAIGVIFAGAFALGIALLSATDGYAVDLAHFLFGNLLGVTASDLWAMGVLSFIVLTVIVLLFKELQLVSFDPLLARTLRLPVRALDYLLLLLIAVTIVVALQVVGVALMLAMLITPAAAASLFTRRLLPMMLWGAVIGASSGAIGLYASFYLNIASGPAVVLVATLIFGLVYLFAPERGLISRRMASA
ncbi:MAG: metal ABC transporter permease [Anaerolineae bacterium]|nr:metal ABC transporter permease [Anaerolineae bacterium]MCO5197360.1 metal ABC transporter permease [Anaerolineae bacterium]MCO5205008.1 metal ABC transporter permease [Anaerolineae bacterium]